MNNTKKIFTSFDEVLKTVISKKSKNYYKKNSFWKSDLPLVWCKEFMSHPIGNELLLTYFSNSKFLNLTFLKKVSEIDTSKLIRAIKLTKAYENDKHWESFSWFKIQRNTDLKRLYFFYKELEFIKKAQIEWEKDSRFYESIISGYSYEDILIHTISYFEKFKRSPQTINNRSKLIMYEVNLCHVLNKILNLKKHLSTGTNDVYSIEKFKAKVKENLPPINPPQGIAEGKYLPIEKITDEKKLLRETIEFFYSHHEIERFIELYLCGHADFEYIDMEDWEGELLTNSNYMVHWRNDKKCYHEEIYLMNRSSKSKDSKNISDLEEQTKNAIKWSFEYWKNLKLSPIINTKNDADIDIEDVLTLLKSFSNYIMPSGRQIITSYEDTEEGRKYHYKGLAKHIKPSDFSKLFYSDYLFIMDESELIDKCTIFFKWSENDMRNIINFLATDLNSTENLKIDFLSKPFIKIGTHYIWLSSLLRDRRWEGILHRRIVNDSLNNHNSQTPKVEKSLSDDFKKAGFQSENSHIYKLNSGISGDLDVVAFKDNTLFIIELKTTYIDENLKRFTKYQTQKFEYKATEQLDKAVSYIKNDFELFKKNSQIEIDCTFENLKIIPLIVSNSFESDDISVGDYLKLSLFELQIILRNDLYNMLVIPGKTKIPFNTIWQTVNQNNEEFNDNIKEVNEDDCNLWTSKNECSAEDLIDAIKQDKIWQCLDDLRKLRGSTPLVINKYDKNREKFLA